MSFFEFEEEVVLHSDELVFYRAQVWSVPANAWVTVGSVFFSYEEAELEAKSGALMRNGNYKITKITRKLDGPDDEST